MMMPFVEYGPEISFKKPIDSIAVSGHKMLGCPMPCGVTIARALSALAVTGVPSAHAKPSELATAGLSKEELYAKAKARSEAEKVAALPINRIKSARTELATAPDLIASGEWTTLRDLIQSSTGPPLVKTLDEGKFKAREVRVLTSKLRKQLLVVDAAAYSQQSFPGADVFAGYCSPGVVPREEGGCKVKPSMDTVPLLASIKDALATFDELISVCGA